MKSNVVLTSSSIEITFLSSIGAFFRCYASDGVEEEYHAADRHIGAEERTCEEEV